MYFEDYSKSKPNVNLGNKGITKKDDFLKKMKEDEQKERRKEQIEQSQLIVKEYFSSSLKTEGNSKQLISNLQSVISYIEKTPSLSQNQRDQIVIKSLDKTITQSIAIFKSKVILLKDKFSLLKVLSHLIINYLSFPNILSLSSDSNPNSKDYILLYTCLLKVSIVEVYENAKKDYLLNENYALFSLLNIFINTLPKSTLDIILMKIQSNISLIFLLKYILFKIEKIINKSCSQIMMSFIGSIANKIIQKRLRCKSIANDYETSAIIDSYLEGVLMTYSYLDNNFQQGDHCDLSLFNLCLHVKSSAFISKLKPEQCINLLKTFTNDITHSRNNHFGDDHIILLSSIFKQLTLFDLHNVNRSLLLKNINDILEHLFRSQSSFLPNSIISLIHLSSKLIKGLYESNYEKTTYQSILDHIVNKICSKHYQTLSDDILTYSVKLLQEYNNKSIGISKMNYYYKDSFEVICFFIIEKINYKSNYFFVEFKATKDIYENLPFNYYYLNLLSKFLITLFTDEISSINLDEIDKLKDDLILLCLKSLYLLDGDINFTYNREQFWNNLEIISKTASSTNKELLIEKMKIMPFIFPLSTRLALGTKEMKKWVEANQNSISNFNNNSLGFYDEEFQGVNEIVIHRNRIFESSIGYYIQNQLPLHKRWSIAFVDQFQQREMGIDGGGLYKEYMVKLSEEGYGNSIGLFVESASGFLLPNKDSSKISNLHLVMFEFLGFITGKALREDIKLSCNLSPIFLNNILDIENSFIDLKSYDSELYKNLALLMQYQGEVETDFGLTFSLTQDLGENKTKTINLIDNGENIPVTNNNKLLYIKKVTEYKLNFQFKDQCNAFRIGMEKAVDMEILKVYTANELRQLIYGFDKDAFDVADLQMNALYEGWNSKNTHDMATLENLWIILNEFDAKEKEKFLFFVTSLKRPPIGGFSKLNPKFRISKSGIDIPTSSTCANMLKLPMLPLDKLREKLRYVINADAGFYYA